MVIDSYRYVRWTKKSGHAEKFTYNIELCKKSLMQLLLQQN